MILEGYGTYTDSGKNEKYYTYRGKSVPIPRNLYQSYRTWLDDGPNAPGTQPFHKWKMSVERILDYEAGDPKPVIDTGSGNLPDTLKAMWSVFTDYSKVGQTLKEAYDQLFSDGTTSRVPSAGSAYAVSSGSTEAPASPLDSYDAYLKTLKDISEANNAFNVEQAQKQMDWSSQQNQIMMDFNAAEAQKNREWQQMMSDTAYQRQVADLQAAGLNPILAINGGNGASVTSGSAASAAGNGSGAKATADTVFASAMLSMFNSAMDVAEKSAEATISANRVAYSNTSSDSRINLKNILSYAKDFVTVLSGLRKIF